jgi:hypothetical protein
MSTAQDAAELADQVAAAIRGQEAVFPKLKVGAHWAQEYLKMCVEQALTHGMKPMGKLPPKPHDNRVIREVIYTSQDAAVRRLWQQHRIVYDIDLTLWAELGETDLDTVVPAGLFAKLPHPDPFVAIPTPIRMPLRDGSDESMLLVGFFVVGRANTSDTVQTQWDGVMQVSTHAPNTNGMLGLLTASYVLDRNGDRISIGDGQYDMVFNRMTLEVGNDTDVTMNDLIKGVIRRFDAYSGANSLMSIPAHINACVSALIYLCSTNAELRPLPASTARRKAKGRGAAKPPKVIQVGYQVGAALKAYRRAEASEAAAPGTGGKKRPHIRRAHFHLYWKGAGRTEPEMKWLSPIPINASDKPARKSTVVKVQKLHRS